MVGGCGSLQQPTPAQMAAACGLETWLWPLWKTSSHPAALPSGAPLLATSLAPDHASHCFSVAMPGHIQALYAQDPKADKHRNHAHRLLSRACKSCGLSGCNAVYTIHCTPRHTSMWVILSEHICWSHPDRPEHSIPVLEYGMVPTCKLHPFGGDDLVAPGVYIPLGCQHHCVALGSGDCFDALAL